MTDSELRDKAVEHLENTTITYPAWKKRVDSGYYKNPENTEWGRAFDTLAQIGEVIPSPTQSSLAALRICSDCAANAGDLSWANYIICHQWERSFLTLPGKCLAYRNASFASSSGGLEKLEMQPDWFAKIDGQPATSNYFPNAYFADVGHPGYQQAWVDKVLDDCKDFDGVFLDDVNVSQTWHLKGRIFDKYPTEAQWTTAMESFLAYVGPRLKAATKLCIPNVMVKEYWKEPTKELFVRWATHCSGALKEYYTKWGTENNLHHTNPDFDHWQDIARRIQEANRIFIGLTYAPMSDTRSQLYARAAFLLEYVPESNSALIFQPTNPEGQPPWSAIWTEDLGLPTDPKVWNGTEWSRQYENGYVTVNPTTAIGVIS